MQHDDYKELPLVSVLMTAYNSSEFILRAIESVQEQTYINFELIIVDDDSTDNTFHIASIVAKNDPRITVYKNEKNLGDYGNRAVAASYARGKYFKYLDSDNYLYPHGLSVLVSCMEKHPEAGLGLCKIHGEAHPLPDVLSPVEAYRETFFNGGLLTNAPSSTIIKSDAYRIVGGFLDTRHRGDFELWLKLAACFSVVRIPGILDWNGIHPDQESHKNATKKVAITYNITINALESLKCPFTKTEKIKALTLYKKNFIINTFVKKLISREFSLRELKEIYHSLNFSKKDLYNLLGR